MTIQEQIIILMRAKQTAKLVYQDKSGNLLNREVEPYSFGPDEVFGYCVRDRHIKRFKFAGIVSVEAGAAFTPRQQIKIPGEPPVGPEGKPKPEPYTPSKQISDAPTGCPKAPWESL